MCHTGNCEFEDHYGECCASRIADNFKLRYGEDYRCEIGNYEAIIDGEDYIDPRTIDKVLGNKSWFDLIYKDYKERIRNDDWNDPNLISLDIFKKKQ